MAPTVAILVLNYNGRSCLLETLQSLANLRYEAKQVWVIDNASEDGSLALAQERFPDFKYLPLAQNYGFAGGMNQGLKAASAEGADFFWLFNYDARAEKGSLESLISAANEYPQAGLLSPGIMTDQGEVWFGGGSIDFLRMRTKHRFVFQQKTPYSTEFLTGCALLIRKETFEKVGLLDEQFFLYYEDADYSLRARRAGFGLLLVSEARVVHSEESRYNPAKTYHLVLSGLIFFQKHARGLFRFYQGIYVTIRRIKNHLDVRLGRDQAQSVRQAYDDFSLFRKTPHFADFR